MPLGALQFHDTMNLRLHCMLEISLPLSSPWASGSLAGCVGKWCPEGRVRKREGRG